MSGNAAPMKTVLAPVDFSHVTASVVDKAAELGRAIGGRMVILHVVSPPIIPGDNPSMIADVSRMYGKEAAGTRTELAGIKSRLHEAGMEVETVEVVGLPTVKILEQAAMLGADYIVMGSHGHGAVYDLLIGGTTHAVLKRARCPVVVVPAPLGAAGKSARRAGTS
jgi:nucleotide-binding universal stress UspA family protein